jgi:hypothetical protein
LEPTNTFVTGIYIVLAVVITVIALIEAYHIQIVNALTPVTRWLHE